MDFNPGDRTKKLRNSQISLELRFTERSELEGKTPKKDKFTMASHFESSELQLTPQLTPLFAYLLFVHGMVTDGDKLKVKFFKQKFQIIGWGIAGAHDEYSRSVRPYVLFENMNGAAAVPLDVLLAPNLGISPPAWDVNESDAELLEDEAGKYALVRISKKKPSRRRWRKIKNIQRMLLSIEYQAMLDERAAAQSSKKKKKK